jgi:PKD repeat protein
VIVGETLHVTATVNGDDPITPTWDLRGMSRGAQLTTLTPALTYNEAGTYTIKLNVVNSCPTTDTHAITVTVQPKPPACIPVSIERLEGDSPTPLGEQTHFTATVSGNAPITYTWDFNSDGIPEQRGTALSQTTHLYPLATTYIAPHTYDVTLHIANPCPSSSEQTIQIRLESPMTTCEPAAGATFTYTPSAPKVGEIVHFSGQVDQGEPPITWIWSFGDGTVERSEPLDGGQTVSHPYTFGDTYTVVMTATNCAGGGTASTARAFTVTPTRYYIHLPLITRNHRDR